MAQDEKNSPRVAADGLPAERSRISEIDIAPGPRGSLSVRILAGLAVLTVLYFARDVLIPVLFAVLLALLLRPGLRPMRRFRVPEVVSAFVFVGIAASIFTIAMVTLAGQAQNWLAQAPDTVQKVSRMVPAGMGPFSDLERTTTAMKDLAGTGDATAPVRVEVQSNDFAYAVLGVSGHFVGGAVVVFVLSFFLLALSGSLLKQAVESRERFGEKRNIVELVQNVEQGISKYLITVTIINAGLGAATGLVLWLLGIPNPVLWGVLAGTSNYVPHVGAFLCMVVLFFVGAVTHESIGYGALAAGCFATLTSLESYFITPLALRKSLHLSPLATVLAILFFGWMWGIAGGLMAAPLLAIIKITSDQFESLKWMRWILCGEEASPAPKPAAANNNPEAVPGQRLASAAGGRA